MHSWSEEGEPLRLQELVGDKKDPDPKALACYGMLSADSGRMYLRFVEGRPVSQMTTDFLEWLCEQVQAQGKRALVLIWDNARLSREQAGQSLAASTQSNGVARSTNRQTGHTHHSMLVAHQKPVAQPD